MIFSEERFTKPYLELRIDDAVTNINFEVPENSEHLRKAFRNHYREATNSDFSLYLIDKMKPNEPVFF